MTECDFVIHSVFRGGQTQRTKVKGNPTMILFSGENLDSKFYTDIEGGYSLSFEADSDTNLYFPLWQMEYENWAKIRGTQPLTKPADAKFCTFIVGNRHPLYRKEVFWAVSDKYKKIDSCGTWFNTIGNPLPSDKSLCAEFHRNYKFNLCFENSKSLTPSHSYITEKLMNAYTYGVVPIYWGSDDVTRWFNPDSFINCNDTQSVSEIIDRIRKIDSDPEAYHKMLNAYPFNDQTINWQTERRRRWIEFFCQILQKINKTEIIPLGI